MSWDEVTAASTMRTRCSGDDEHGRGGGGDSRLPRRRPFSATASSPGKMGASEALQQVRVGQRGEIDVPPAPPRAEGRDALRVPVHGQLRQPARPATSKSASHRQGAPPAPIRESRTAPADFVLHSERPTGPEQRTRGAHCGAPGGQRRLLTAGRGASVTRRGSSTARHRRRFALLFPSSLNRPCEEADAGGGAPPAARASRPSG